MLLTLRKIDGVYAPFFVVNFKMRGGMVYKSEPRRMPGFIVMRLPPHYYL